MKYQKKVKLKAKATPNKKPVSSKRGNDGAAPKSAVKKSLSRKKDIENVKF